ncbi:MAG: terminase small subunit [Desulfovibrionaceae bacterium]|nr:terminase small subunit [Desulfovibrionaceae bacterium]
MARVPERTDGPAALTGLQERFVQEYLVDLNATRAAERAGYSPRTAPSTGARLKNLPHVKARIEAAMAERTARTRIRQDRVVMELARLAFSDIREFADWDEGGVRIRDSGGMGPEQSACIAEIVETPGKEGRKLRVKLHGKTRALEVLCRHLGLFEKAPRQTEGAVIQVVTHIPEPDWDGATPPGGASLVSGPADAPSEAVPSREDG